MPRQFSRQMLEKAKRQIYIPEMASTIPDADVLGVLAARHLDWIVADVIQMAHAAFEEANVHDLAAVLRERYPQLFEGMVE